MIYSEIAVQKF